MTNYALTNGQRNALHVLVALDHVGQEARTGRSTSAASGHVNAKAANSLCKLGLAKIRLGEMSEWVRPTEQGRRMCDPT